MNTTQYAAMILKRKAVGRPNLLENLAAIRLAAAGVIKPLEFLALMQGVSG